MEINKHSTLELKDFEPAKRTATIKHSVYNSIDRYGDIAHKGMFTKSWNEKLPEFYFNHDKNRKPGKVLRVFEDESGAYSEVKFAKTTIGNDVLEMLDEGMITGASFGYYAMKKDYSEIKGKRIRNLREVKQDETSILDVLAAHPEAGVISYVKSFEYAETTDDLVIVSGEHLLALKSYVEKIETYCRKATASDETIIALQNANNEYKLLIQSIDTAITQLIPEPIVSDDEIYTITNFIKTLN